MGKKHSNFLFNTIAPVYALFYKGQKKTFRRAIARIEKDLDLSTFDTVLDIGCGTGALCSVLRENGFSATGIDPAQKMLRIARKNPQNTGIEFVCADVLEKLPFEDKSFDWSIASYVAHGLRADERKRMYAEMNRVTQRIVVIHDYNANRSFMTSLIEWLERGDYFQFIKVAEDEMRNCVSEMKECFSHVRVIDVDKRAAWYICTPTTRTAGRFSF
ncbi:MAG: methyltransferase domain-containing protein [Clostridiales bacterium]|nr:methyltransferase domain-containing protein [Clostridiales bacterium]